VSVGRQRVSQDFGTKKRGSDQVAEWYEAKYRPRLTVSRATQNDERRQKQKGVYCELKECQIIVHWI
jgi:hypothetical protein